MEKRENISNVYYFLKEDYKQATERLSELSSKIKELADEQAEGRSQSTENMGHDDAVQESVEQERKVVLKQISELSRVLGKAEIIEDISQKQKIQVGSKVTLSNGKKIKIGSYMSLDKSDGDYVIASYPSPIAKPMIGLEVGDTFNFRGENIEIVSID